MLDAGLDEPYGAIRVDEPSGCGGIIRYLYILFTPASEYEQTCGLVHDRGAGATP